MELNTYSFFKALFLSVLGAAIIYLGAMLSFKLPNADIPQTAQTLSILAIAAIFGQVVGFFSVTFYLVLGVIGFPVFANGATGIEVLTGPTKGYLFGFMFAAIFCGWWFQNCHARKFILSSMGMLISHLLILIMGWLWLSSIQGPAAAFETGVKPFVVGALFKSILASAIVVGYFQIIEKIKSTLPNKKKAIPDASA